MGKWQLKDVLNASKTVISHALSRQSITNSLHDLSETVAYAQQRQNLQAAFKESRRKDRERYQENFWLSAYQILEGDFTNAVQRCREVANVFVALNDGAEAWVAQVKNAPLTAKIQADLQQIGQEMSSHPVLQDLQKAVEEGVGDDLRYWGYELQTQKELLLDSVRGLVDRKPLPSIDYFLDDQVEEWPQGSTEISGQNSVLNNGQRQHQDDTLESYPRNPGWGNWWQSQGLKLGQYAWQRACQDSRFLAERFGYVVLDALEMEAEKNNPQLAQTLAEIRQQGTHRVATHKLRAVSQAVNIVLSTMQQQGRQIQEIMAESHLSASMSAETSR